MSAQENDPPIRYRLEISGNIKNEIRKLAKYAASIGQRQAYHQAWLAIEKRLVSEPLQFGECRYHMAKGKLRCHIGVIQPVAVEFAIYAEKHGVILLKVFLLGLDEG